jgi:uroporphyrinogen decarboxylase
MPIERPFKKTYNWEHLEKVLRRETTDGPVPIIELLVDAEPMSEVTGIDYPASKAVEIFTNAGAALNDESVMAMGIKLMDLSLAFSTAVGYDYVTMIPIVPIRKTSRNLADDPDEKRHKRAWIEETKGIISSRREFEEYEWPSLEQVSLLPIDYAGGQLPPGMKVMVQCDGIFEILKELMGLQQMAICSINEPALVDDILEKLTRIMIHTVDIVAAHPATGAIFYGEDMGASAGTLLSPKFLKKYVIPRLKLIADACHRHGKLFLFHTCGQVEDIMEDLIDVVGIDGKHSFQDNVQPVEDYYKKYHDRIAVLGGLDMNLLASGTPEEVKARTRQILKACAPGGGFCLGSGNSISNYVKIENYYTMLDETRKWNEEHGY